MQPARHLRFINPVLEREILVGIVRKSTDIWAVVAVDLFSGDGQILFEGPDFIYAPQIAGGHVIWSTLRKLYVYSVSQKSLEELQQVGEAPRHARISGDIIVWEYTPSLLSAEQDIWGYDLKERESFPVVTLPGVQSGPLISGRWVLYLDSTDMQAEGWDGGLYAVHLNTGETIRLGQIYARWPHETSQYYAIDAPWVAWTTGYWSANPELYLYNLEIRRAYTVPVVPCGASAAQPQRIGRLAISENTVIFTCGQPMGYDIERRVFFSIPIYAAKPAGEEWGFGGWSIAGDRIVWVLSSEQESRVYTAQIEHRP